MFAANTFLLWLILQRTVNQSASTHYALLGESSQPRRRAGFAALAESIPRLRTGRVSNYSGSF